jgi:hypothetical protein
LFSRLKDNLEKVTGTGSTQATSRSRREEDGSSEEVIAAEDPPTIRSQICLRKAVMVLVKFPSTATVCVIYSC